MQIALSNQEQRDLLMLAALIVIGLPLAPDRTLHEHFPINPYVVVKLIVVMSIVQVLGYASLRLMGSRLGVPLAGLMSGFISSMATHAAMGARAREHPQNNVAYASAAVLSNVATALQALFITATIAPQLLTIWAPYLGAMFITALACGAVFFRRIQESEVQIGLRVFSLAHAATFALLFSAVVALCTFIRTHWGEQALWAAASLSSIVDVHVAISSLATFDAALTNSRSTVIALLICLTINATVKGITTLASAGASRFAAEVITCLLMIAAVPWVVWLFLGNARGAG
jgi:uncharacterized membrane protein (DUF4010 family)